MIDRAEDDVDWDDFRNPVAKNFRTLFEMILLWGIVWSVGVCAAWLVSVLLDQAAVPMRSNWNALPSLLAGLATVIAIAVAGDKPRGKACALHLRRIVRLYGYPLILVCGLLVGWQWRDHWPPNPERESAINAASSICGKIPLCVYEATRANQGNDVSAYISRR